MKPAFLLVSLLLLVVLFPVQADHTPQLEHVTFVPEDLTAITLYGESAKYRPNLCPGNVTFLNRARLLPELATNKIGIFPSEISVDGTVCKADALMLVFTPIGRPTHLPPQWIFEDSTLAGHPVNFTCGNAKFSIRFGYFNDVKTPTGFLDPNVVYLDFAVIPNTKPFAFCSYATRRTDGKRPINFAPFPTRKIWSIVQVRNAGRPLPSFSPSPLPRTVEPSPEALGPSPSPEMELDDQGDDSPVRDIVSVVKQPTSSAYGSMLARTLFNAWSSW